MTPGAERLANLGVLAPLRYLGLAGWQAVNALAGLPSLFFSHRLARRSAAKALFTIVWSSVPVLTILSALTGLAVASSTGVVLNIASLDSTILRVLRHIMTRDFIPLLVGILVACRSGVALAISMRRMSAGGEVDAFRIMGENPSRRILSPALLGFLSASLVLFLWGILAAHLSAALLFDHLHVVTTGRYWDLVIAPIRPDLLYGLMRSVVFAALAFSVSAVEGSRPVTGRELLEEAASQTYVRSLIAVFTAEAALAAINA